jgi:hypothetical protein
LLFATAVVMGIAAIGLWLADYYLIALAMPIEWAVTAMIGWGFAIMLAGRRLMFRRVGDVVAIGVDVMLLWIAIASFITLPSSLAENAASRDAHFFVNGPRSYVTTFVLQNDASSLSKGEYKILFHGWGAYYVVPADITEIEKIPVITIPEDEIESMTTVERLSDSHAAQGASPQATPSP